MPGRQLVNTDMRAQIVLVSDNVKVISKVSLHLKEYLFGEFDLLIFQQVSDCVKGLQGTKALQPSDVILDSGHPSLIDSLDDLLANVNCQLILTVSEKDLEQLEQYCARKSTQRLLNKIFTQQHILGSNSN